MTCGSLAEIILDLARGAAVPEASRRGAERHMDGCRTCATEYARQRQLSAGLQALAVEAQEWQAPAAMEERLLAVFAERQAVATPVTVATLRWKYALPVAAAVALAVWGGVRLMREPAPDFRLKAEATHPQMKAEATSALRASVDKATSASHAAPLRQPGLKTRPPQHLAREFANPRTAPPLAVSERIDRASRTANPRPAASVAAVEFVRIPSAIGLPDMESGTVVRMELPLTSLPEYGLDIAPDAARTSVEADVLVGQDGQPRAIRLVGIPEAVAQDPRSRQ